MGARARATVSPVSPYVIKGLLLVTVRSGADMFGSNKRSDVFVLLVTILGGSNKRSDVFVLLVTILGGINKRSDIFVRY
jgi:hypothetical protein